MFGFIVVVFYGKISTLISIRKGLGRIQKRGCQKINAVFWCSFLSSNPCPSLQSVATDDRNSSYNAYKQSKITALDH